MQEENKKNNIKTISFGCRLNALESEKIKNMLNPVLKGAIVVNTCAVTAEAERQSGQAVRRIVRDNPNVPVFVTGCAATRNPDLFSNIKNVNVISNFNKMSPNSYLNKSTADLPYDIQINLNADAPMSKQFIQIQNGCNHRCAYCITRALRGPSVSFEYDQILNDVKSATNNGFYEIVLTGIDIASYVRHDGDKVFLLSDLCKKLLADVPEIRRLRLSSVDPGVPDIEKIIDLILQEDRMMPHMHFSMQSGSNTILRSMERRHTSERVRDLVARAKGMITFSWDIICGFPGETNELFDETLNLIHETKPIKIHAFPFSPRPGTVAAEMPNQIDRSISKQRVKIINEQAEKYRKEYMRQQIGKTVQVLVEENNIARDAHDITVKIGGDKIPAKTICNVKIIDLCGDTFVGNLQ